MIKPVLFDFCKTLVSFNPPREELQATACRELGLGTEGSKAPRGHWAADDLMSRENARVLILSRPEKDALPFWAGFGSVFRPGLPAASSSRRLPASYQAATGSPPLSAHR